MHLIYLGGTASGGAGGGTPRGRSEVEQWLMWQMSALGPMIGNCMYFKRIASPQHGADLTKLQFGIDRYHNESLRLLQVMESRLAEGPREFLCGSGKGALTCADLACYGYTQCHWWAGIALDPFPHVRAWLARLTGIESARTGLKFPTGKVSMMADDWSEEAAEHRRRVEQHAVEDKRVYFGWKDLAALKEDSELSGIFTTKEEKIQA
ncbi:hypothetical protein CYMTET_26382 [Cymbomonas tetramitiformis]|uniref:GST C-terminal domain-containing protein n=1 Tax=Cymbomonas tetramitiformis TaxID=36881 RepID=A0AAE0KY81_9CHLO|nr:hypothetical protein CYMTET_26382 [Cymbomonas tetramitiformis]